MVGFGRNEVKQDSCVIVVPLQPNFLDFVFNVFCVRRIHAGMFKFPLRLKLSLTMPPRRKAAAVEVSMEESDDRDEGIIVNIHKCLDGKATSADVGRLWKQAAELEKVNWNQPETLSLKALLVSCFEARVFYKSAQGINFFY